MTELLNKEQLDKLSTQELQELLEQRKKDEKAVKERERKQYELKRDRLVNRQLQRAKRLSSLLEEFKSKSFDDLEDFNKDMLSYGDYKKDGKGNFTIKNEDSTQKIEFSRQPKFEFDERAAIAEQHIKDFLSDMVKKKDLKIYNIITSLLEKRNKQYDPRLISKLYQHEFEDERWVKGIKLFKESYRETGSRFYVRFYEQNENGEWNSVNLNFSSL